MTKKCPECSMRESPRWNMDNDNVVDSVIAHYLDAHPRSDSLIDVVDGTYVERECNDCGELFESECSIGYVRGEKASINAEAYCSDCADDKPIRGVMVVGLTPAEYVKMEIE